MKRIIRLFFILLVLLAAGVWFGKDIIARKAVEAGVTQATGFPLEVGSLSADLGGHRIDVRDMKLKNPAGFDEPLFVEMPQLAVNYDLGSMFGQERHLHELLVDIKQLQIVKDKKGETNVSKLQGVLGGGGGKSKYRIDTFRLKVGTVTMKDYSGAKMTERNIPANLDVTFRDLTDSTDINRLVLVTLMSKLHLPDIGVGLSALTQGLSKELLAPAGDLLKGASEAAAGVMSGSSNLLQKTGKGLFKSLDKIIK